jgi:ABC-type bacteriocin/lantibiotic exporter with double-glycine peptidase domain
MAGRAIPEYPSAEPDGGHDLHSDKLTGDIRLRHVSYRYPEASQQTLADIDLTVRRNTLVAFVGASGAGKSTIADIILGLLAPDEGELCVGNVPIGADNVRSWQRQLGYVPQTIFIADDTIAANIAFGVSRPDPAAVARAARLANIDAHIESLPETYQYRVGERGALLSGGQRQRLGIARALYRDPKILVMDEATSALDAVTEHEIMETLLHLKEEKTVIMVAHRLSTIEAADSVVLVDRGRVVDIGTSGELQSRNPLFRRIVLASKGERSVAAEDLLAVTARI